MIDMWMDDFHFILVNEYMYVPLGKAWIILKVEPTAPHDLSYKKMVLNGVIPTIPINYCRTLNYALLHIFNYRPVFIPE